MTRVVASGTISIEKDGLFLGGACSPCCKTCYGCAKCGDGASQVVLEFTSGGGSGLLLAQDGVPQSGYSIECFEESTSVVLDLEETCCVFMFPFEFCESQVSHGGDTSVYPNAFPKNPIQKCRWGEYYGVLLSFDFSAVGTYGGAMFPTEGLTLAYSVSHRSSVGVAVGSVVASQKVRVLRFRDRVPPEFAIGLGGGSGGVLSLDLEQLADGYGNPYWRIRGVDIVSGGTGYPEFVPCELQLLNGTGYVPQLYVRATNGVITSAEVEYQDAPGPFTGLTGYHVERERYEPTVEAVPPSHTTGVELEVTLEQVGSGSLATWKVSDVTITNAGSGWLEYDVITFRATENADLICEEQATAHCQFKRIEPTLAASVDVGTGATFAIELTEHPDSPQAWTVESVSVSGTTVGYLNRSQLAFAGDGVTTETAAYAYIVVKRTQPSISADVETQSGVGASLSVTLSQIDDPAELVSVSAWTVSGVNIDVAGEGYQIGDYVSGAVVDGQVSELPGVGQFAFSGYVSDVAQNGAILAVAIGNGGAYFKSTGEIDQIVVESGGRYYALELEDIVIDGGGVYYCQTYTVTTTPIEPPDCKDIEAWEVLLDEPEAGPAVGELWNNQIATESNLSGNTILGLTSIRRCESAEVTVTVQ